MRGDSRTNGRGVIVRTLALVFDDGDMCRRGVLVRRGNRRSMRRRFIPLVLATWQCAMLWAF